MYFKNISVLRTLDEEIMEDVALDGVRVHDTESPHGRVLVATRSFAAGEIVLEEALTLEWAKEDPSQLVAAFLSAGPSVQAAILDMAMPNASLESNERVQGRRSLAKTLANSFEGPRVLELIETLLAISDTNAHSVGCGMALFEMASKANHSCAPNCGSSTRVDGRMRYFAHRAIPKGQMISISYLSDLWQTSTSERRATLLKEKCFDCHCCRCDGPEEDADARCRRERLAKVARESRSAVDIARAFAALECRASGCTSDACLAERGALSLHPPCPSLVADAVTTFLACCAADRQQPPEAIKSLPNLAASIAARYTPWATLQFGPRDVAVRAMAATVAAVPPPVPPPVASLESPPGPSHAAATKKHQPISAGMGHSVELPVDPSRVPTVELDKSAFEELKDTVRRLLSDEQCHQLEAVLSARLLAAATDESTRRVAPGGGTCS